MILKKLYTILFFWKVLFANAMVFWGVAEDKELLWKDLARIGTNGLPYTKPGYLMLDYVLLTQKQFRAIFYYRYRKYLIGYLSRIFLPSTGDIEVKCQHGSIGGGILFYHAMGRVIEVFSCGDNLTVSQGVTIGLGHTNSEGRNAPIIGNNCLFATNSIVFGPIIIGDNVIIGAGSVVTKDVPANCTVIGNPARIIKMNGEKVNIPI